MGQKVKLPKSNVIGKTPNASAMEFGELYVNYASGTGNSFLVTKKNDGSLAKFPESASVVNALSNKVDKVANKGLSTNDYTTAEKNKLAGIASGAEVNVQSDWNATSGDAFILNKPTIPTTIESLTDTTIVEPTTLQSLVYSGSTWKNDYPLAGSIPYGKCDPSSTSKSFTATVPGITELRDGTCMLLKNGVVTSTTGFTIDVNGLGAKPVYNNMASATSETTLFNKNYTILFIYDETRVSGGCWIYYRGYDANTTYTNVTLGQGYASSKATTSSTAKTATLSSYKLTANGIVSVKFSGDVPANATLNINNAGAKQIYYKGAQITNGVIKAGDTATFMYNTYYHLLTIDRWNSDFSGNYNDLTNKPELSTVATSGSYNDLSNKPNIGNGALTIKRNGTSLGSFSANQTDNKEIDISVPTKTSELTNNSNFITSAVTAMTNYATSANVVTALSGKANTGDIKDSTITIQKNGTNVDSFTLNQSSNKTINITVPTSASDINALPTTTKYAASMSLDVNSSTYVVTAQLKDQDGNNLGTAQTIDLPLESVVVNGAYIASGKTVQLTLQNGNKIEFSVADLVSGLQTELSSNNKLNADYIQDGTNNKVFTSTDKTKLGNLTTSIATTGASGYMSSAMVTKLNGIATGAEVNQNAFSNVKVDSTTIAADGKTDTLELVAGSNITLTPDATNDKITIAATNTTYTAATATPMTVTSATGVVGTSDRYAREDHKHQLTLATGDANGQVKIGGTNVSVKGLGSAAYTESSAYATASHNQALSTITGADDLKAIENLTGTSGLLKKTAANTWSLDTTKYIASGDAVTALNKKVDKVNGKGLSTNDYTTTEKNKLAGIAEGAEVNVQSDWNATSGDALILNKPTIPTVNDSTITIQKNGSTVKSFTLNQATGETINITVPTNVNELTNGSGYITTADTKDFITSAVTKLKFFATSSDTVTALNGKQNTISDLAKIRSDAASGYSAYQTLTGHVASASHITSTDRTNWNKKIDSGVTAMKNFATSAAVVTALSGKANTGDIKDSTITIQTNSNTVDTFTLNQSSNKTINIPIPTDVSDFTNDAGYITTADTTGFIASATVVTALNTKVDKETGKGLSTNDYTTEEKNKLAGIEANAQVNGFAFKTIKANTTAVTATSSADTITLTGSTNISLTATGNATTKKIQISATGLVPTGRTVNGKNLGSNITLSASDVSALPNTTKYAASIDLTKNNTTFQYTWQLKDQDGNNLGTAQTLDLPIESVVVGGKYIASAKTVQLVLQSGSTIEFSIADLVSGLQTEITSTNKLSADLIQDGTTNKVFTSTDKTKLGNLTTSIATTGASGYMSSAMVTKLNEIATGAEVNQNAFSNVKVDSTTIAADGKTDTLELVAGSNITLTPDATNDKITIDATNTTYTAATATPMTVTSATGVVGTSDRYAREDHKHQLTLATGDANGQVKIGGTNVSVKGLGSAAYTNSSAYVPTGRTVNGKNLGSNITLSASDVSALTNTTKYAASIDLTQNETNFQYTWQLKDQDGNNLGTAQTLDLPIDFFDCVMTEENAVWSCDKNWLEIYNAHINGIQIRLKHDADIYMPIIVEATIALFGYTTTLNEFDTPRVISKALIFDLNGDVFPVGWSQQEYVSFPFSSSDKAKLDYIDANYINSGVTAMTNYATSANVVTAINKKPDVAFKTIKANTTAVTATSSADTITLTGSTYISLAATGTGTTKKIQISATGLQPSISDLATIRSNAASGYSAYTGLTANYATSADVVTALNNKVDDSEIVKFSGPFNNRPNEYYCSHLVNDIISKVENKEAFSISFIDTNGFVWQPDRIVCNNDTATIYLKTPELSNVKLPNYSVHDYYISANTTFNLSTGTGSYQEAKSMWYGNQLLAIETLTLKIDNLLSGSPENGNLITYTTNNNSSAWTPVGRNSIIMNVNGTNYNFIGISPDNTDVGTYIPINTELAENVTYAQLKTDANNGWLTPNKQYRITDYVTTTAQEYTRSAGHQFDLIVRAISNNKIDCKANAAIHSGDTSGHFSLCDMSKWQIWYDLDNDTEKYAWANSATGKGVIYRMIDEWGNDCPYDFKNIQYTRPIDANGIIEYEEGEDEWVYTFSWRTQGGVIEDVSIICKTLGDDLGAVQGLFNNVIKPLDSYDIDSKHIMVLSNNVFFASYAYEGENCFYGFNDNTIDKAKDVTLIGSCKHVTVNENGSGAKVYGGTNITINWKNPYSNSSSILSGYVLYNNTIGLGPDNDEFAYNKDYSAYGYYCDSYIGTNVSGTINLELGKEHPGCSEMRIINMTGTTNFNFLIYDHNEHILLIKNTTNANKVFSINDVWYYNTVLGYGGIAARISKPKAPLTIPSSGCAEVSIISAGGVVAFSWRNDITIS